MANTVTIEAKTVQAILSELKSLRTDVQAIKEKLLDREPSYGSDEWWEWSMKKGEEDIKAGRSTRIRNKKELQEFFDSLKE